MNVKELKTQLRWKDRETLEGELDKDEIKRRVSVIKKANSYLSGEKIHGDLPLLRIMLEYRGIPLEFTVYRWFDYETQKMREEKGFRIDNDEISRGLQLHFYHHEHELGREPPLYIDTGGIRTLSERRMGELKGKDFRESVENGLEMAAEDLDWLLDKSRRDFKRMFDKDLAGIGGAIKKARKWRGTGKERY